MDKYRKDFITVIIHAVILFKTWHAPCDITGTRCVMMKKMVGIFFFVFTVSCGAFIAENRSSETMFLDNPATLNLMCRTEIGQSISFNNDSLDEFIYHQQVVLPKILFLKTGLSFDGTYSGNQLLLGDFTVLGSLPVGNLVSLGFSGSKDRASGGLLFDLKFFSAGVVFDGLSFSQPYFASYRYGMSLFLDFSAPFQMKLYLDRVDLPGIGDAGKLGVIEMLNFRGINIHLQENFWFDKSTLNYDLAVRANLKDVSLEWDYGRQYSGMRNMVSCKFCFDSKKVDGEKKKTEEGYYLFMKPPENGKIVFEAVLPDYSARYWAIDIFNAQKKQVRSISGLGTCPEFIAWDLNDGNSQPVEPGTYVAKMKITKNVDETVVFDDREFKLESTQKQEEINEKISLGN
jgi:hypothetical protein